MLSLERQTRLLTLQAVPLLCARVSLAVCSACGTDADGNNVKYQCLYLGFWSVVKPCDKTVSSTPTQSACTRVQLTPSACLTAHFPFQCVTESPIQAYCT